MANGLLDVGDGHRLYFETWGNPAGTPVVVLHGGPGSGCSPRLRELYDARRHHVVFFDQRGCGRSLPFGEIRANTTAHLIDDIERLRRHLGIARWWVSGGSWGATLALAYAAAHPQVVDGLVVRSAFLPGDGNVRWFFEGLAALRPEAWRALSAALGGAPDLLAELAFRLSGDDRELARDAALAWLTYEQAVNDPAAPLPSPTTEELDRLVGKYRLQAHYLKSGCFLDEAAFLDACAGLSGVPVWLIHGRDDVVCPPPNAERIHARIAGSRLVWIDGCVHDPFHPGMAAAWRVALGNEQG
ncbi:MAG: alpha/beta fold hydrolase [Proteobacteria bacterium]|nr:alpha/beta fold hydrolase [Pseudomonadota bacterium]